MGPRWTGQQFPPERLEGRRVADSVDSYAAVGEVSDGAEDPVARCSSYRPGPISDALDTPGDDVAHTFDG